MRKKTLLELIVIVLSLSSCSILPFQDVTCNKFSIRGEEYWSPLSVGETIVFVNDKNEEKSYTIVDKYIKHTTNYITDSGCACEDLSGMLLISNNDSIGFNNLLVSQKHQKEQYDQRISFVINGSQSWMFENNKTTLETFSINTITFSNVEQFVCEEYEGELSLKKLYQVKNLGIIQFELRNGEIWRNKNLTEYQETNKDSFKYSEGVCN
jgi:hypothetical protein